MVLLHRWQWLQVADGAAQYVQIIVYGLLDHRGPPLFGVRSGRLALVQLVQPAVPLALLALPASSAVASHRCVWQWCHGPLCTHPDRLIRAGTGRRLVESYA